MDRARAMFSKAVRVSSRLQSWKIKPSRSRRNRVSSFPFRRVSSRPSTRMEPEVGLSMVDTQFKRVVLPEPEAPMMPTYSPASRDRSTPSRARVAAPRFPYTLVRPVTCSKLAICFLSFRRASARPSQLELYERVPYSSKNFPMETLTNFLRFHEESLCWRELRQGGGCADLGILDEKTAKMNILKSQKGIGDPSNRPSGRRR